MPDSIAAIVRYALIAAGTHLATKYNLMDLDITAIAGAVMTLLTVAWGIFVKKGTVAIPANEVKVDQTIVSSMTGGNAN